MTTASLGRVQNQLFSMAHEDKVANVRYNTLRAIYEIKKHAKDKAFEVIFFLIFGNKKIGQSKEVLC